MNGDAMLFMAVSWLFVLTLNAYCFKKLFFGGSNNKDKQE